MNHFHPYYSNLLQRTFRILFLGVLTITVQAQDWPPPGAAWEYCLNPPTVWDEEGTKTFAYTSDTLINGKSYAVIRHVSTSDQVFEEGTEYDFDNRVYVRQSNDTIYRIVNNIDYIFYIYGLDIGEGFTTFRTAFYEYDSYSCDPEIHLEVIEVSTIELDGETFVEVIFEDTNFTDVYDDNYINDSDFVKPQYAFVEGVGLRNDFPYLFHLAVADEGEDCYLSTDGTGEIILNKFSSEEQFVDFNECFSVSVIELEKSNISIFPNPVSEKFRVDIKTGDNDFRAMNVFNQQGKLVKSLNPKNTFHSLSNLTPGLYVLQIETANGFVWKKLVKE